MTRPSTGTREHREWLAELLLRAVDEADAVLPAGNVLAPYVLGCLVAETTLPPIERSALLDRCLLK